MVVPDFEHIPAVTYWPCNNNGPSASGKWFEQAVSFALDTMNMTRGTLVTTNKRVKKNKFSQGFLRQKFAHKEYSELYTRGASQVLNRVNRPVNTETFICN